MTWLLEDARAFIDVMHGGRPAAARYCASRLPELCGATEEGSASGVSALGALARLCLGFDGAPIPPLPDSVLRLLTLQPTLAWSAARAALVDSRDEPRAAGGAAPRRGAGGGGGPAAAGLLGGSADFIWLPRSERAVVAGADSARGMVVASVARPPGEVPAEYDGLPEDCSLLLLLRLGLLATQELQLCWSP